MKSRTAFLACVAALAGLASFCPANTPPAAYSHHRLEQIAGPYRFSLISWELRTLASVPAKMLGKESENSLQTELQGRVKAVLKETGINESPPFSFRLESPPHLLVVSPRDRIAYLDRVVLCQNISLEQTEELEAQAGGLGLSSLVVELGGFGATYPAIVGTRYNLADTIEVAIEEWAHQYLALRPLGFLYLLDSIGVRRDLEIVTMNETLAGIVSREIGDRVYSRYYEAQGGAKTDRSASTFDFDAGMRQTRRAVDQLLGDGRVEEAERYMEERRQVFVAHGYHIRKLNQAYFAFHGIYGDDPASVSPAARDLEQLRAKSPSLKHFLEKAAAMKSYNELTRSLAK